MTLQNERKPRLVGDIGGTNTRLALYDPATRELRARKDYRNRDYPELQDVIEQWLSSLNEIAPSACALAIAAPPFDDRVSMLNMDWSFSCSEVQQRFGFEQLRVLNDFQSNAYSLPYLTAEDLYTLHTGSVGRSGKLAVVGPGTGLGGSSCYLVDGVAVADVCEPGHMGLSPATPLELELFQLLLPEVTEVYAELLLSGPGMARLYHALAQVLGETSQALPPEEISERASNNSCALCRQTVDVFCGLLGSACGDFILAQGAYGGLYLAGGILPQIIEPLQESRFLERLRAKGSMREHLAQVPVHLITSGRAGLLGAANAPL